RRPGRWRHRSGRSGRSRFAANSRIPVADSLPPHSPAADIRPPSSTSSAPASPAGCLPAPAWPVPASGTCRCLRRTSPAHRRTRPPASTLRPAPPRISHASCSPPCGSSWPLSADCETHETAKGVTAWPIGKPRCGKWRANGGRPPFSPRLPACPAALLLGGHLLPGGGGSLGHFFLHQFLFREFAHHGLGQALAHFHGGHPLVLGHLGVQPLLQGRAVHRARLFGPQ